VYGSNGTGDNNAGLMIDISDSQLHGALCYEANNRDWRVSTPLLSELPFLRCHLKADVLQCTVLRNWTSV
jgi:hypothetical protein